MRYIQAAYGSIEKPNRSFALTANKQQPYRAVIADLSVMARIIDDTDINCDVCFTYIVEAEMVNIIRLSMVGPYAMFERRSDAGKVDLIVSEANCSSFLEREILRVLERHGLTLLPREMLIAPIEMNLPDVDRPAVYNALFSPETKY